MKRLLVFLLLPCLCFGQEIKRPTVQAGITANLIGCAGTGAGATPMPNAYDAAGLATSSIALVSADYKHQVSMGRAFSSWQTPGGAYSSLTLNINTASSGWMLNSVGNGSGSACASYSTDSGHSWTQFTCDTGPGFTQQTFSITLPTTTDFTKLQVGVCATATAVNFAGDHGEDSIAVWDIWTSGNGASAPVGNGSTSGLPHRGVVIVN